MTAKKPMCKSNMGVVDAQLNEFADHAELTDNFCGFSAVQNQH